MTGKGSGIFYLAGFVSLISTFVIGYLGFGYWKPTFAVTGDLGGIAITSAMKPLLFLSIWVGIVHQWVQALYARNRPAVNVLAAWELLFDIATSFLPLIAGLLLFLFVDGATWWWYFKAVVFAIVLAGTWYDIPSSWASVDQLWRRIF